MTVLSHVIDILIARYVGPAKQSEWFTGLAIYTMSFPSGRFFKCQQELWASMRQYEIESGLFLFEVARGPCGCFDTLLEDFQKLFDNGLQRYLNWSDIEPQDTWYPPVETMRVLCDRGTFITLETLGTVVPGFPGSGGKPFTDNLPEGWVSGPPRLNNPSTNVENPFDND